MLAMKTELPEDRIQVTVFLGSPYPASPGHAHSNLEERRHMGQSLLLRLNPLSCPFPLKMWAARPVFFCPFVCGVCLSTCAVCGMLQWWFGVCVCVKEGILNHWRGTAVQGTSVGFWGIGSTGEWELAGVRIWVARLGGMDLMCAPLDSDLGATAGSWPLCGHCWEVSLSCDVCTSLRTHCIFLFKYRFPECFCGSLFFLITCMFGHYLCASPVMTLQNVLGQIQHEVHQGGLQQLICAWLPPESLWGTGV